MSDFVFFFIAIFVKKVGKMRFLLSDESVNSYGYKVQTAGIRHPNKAPCLINHDLNSLPVGYFDNFEKKNNALYADLTLDANEVDVWRKVHSGFLDSVSIGFLINEIQHIDGYEVVTDCELKEISLVSVPANSNAKKLKVGEIQTLSIKIMNEKEELTRLQTLSESQKNTILELQNSIAKLNSEKDSEIASLRDEIKRLKSENLEAKANLLIDNALSAKKILPSQKSLYIKLALSDFESTKQLLDSLDVYTPITKQLDVLAGANSELSFSDLFKNNPELLRQIKEKDPERYNEMKKRDSVIKKFS